MWRKNKFDYMAVLCGARGHESTVNEYLGCNSTCPSCRERFNPGCRLHSELYFEQ